MQPLPQDFINMHRCYYNPQYPSRGHPLTNSFNTTNLHSINPINGLSRQYVSTKDFQTKRLQSEKNIAMPTEINHHVKQKRNTFPRLLTEIPLSPGGQILSPNSQPSSNRKIRFTYCSPTNNSFSTPSFSASSSYIHDQLPGRTNVFQPLKKEKKKFKNKLASLEFSFIYVPKQKEKDNYEWTIPKQRSSKNIVEQRRTSIVLVNIFEQSKLANESKMASTIATQSFYNQSQKSGFTSQQNTKGIDNSKIIYFGNNQKSDLMDQLPQAKQLRQTVILTHNDYSFGGIIDKGNNLMESTSLEKVEGKKAIVRECQLRQWNSHVKCLIDNRESQDLKQSIHEGPQIRLERHKFEMLDGFGRDIKESTMSIQL